MTDNPRLKLDPREYGVQTDDIATFSPGGFEWRVDKTNLAQNIVYVTSLVGGRQAVEQYTQVQSVKRDPTYIPEALVDYDEAVEDDD